jgi:hypothetical protein
MTKTCSNWVDTMQISQNCTAIKRTDELPCQGTGSSDLWILLPRPHSLTRFIYYIYFIIIDPDPGSPYPQWRTQGGCTGCTCIPPPPPVHPPPWPCASPPLSSLKGWLWEKIRQWATRKKCKFVYLRLNNFLPRTIIRGVLGNKCAGQHNLKTLHFKETIVLGNF